MCTVRDAGDEPDRQTAEHHEDRLGDPARVGDREQDRDGAHHAPGREARIHDLDYASRTIATACTASPLATIAAVVGLHARCRRPGWRPDGRRRPARQPRGLLAGPDGSIYFAEAGPGRQGLHRRRLRRISRARSARSRRAAPWTRSARACCRWAARQDVRHRGRRRRRRARRRGLHRPTSVGPSVPKGLRSSVKAKIRAQTGRVVRIDAGGKLTPPLARIDRLETRRTPTAAARSPTPTGSRPPPTASSTWSTPAPTRSWRSPEERQVIAVFARATRKADSVPTVVRQAPTARSTSASSRGTPPQRRSRVWRVVPGQKPRSSRAASAASRIAFGADRSMYVSEFSLNFARQSPKGDVVRVAPDGSRTRIGNRAALVPGRYRARPGRLAVRRQLERAAALDAEQGRLQGRPRADRAPSPASPARRAPRAP